MVCPSYDLRDDLRASVQTLEYWLLWLALFVGIGAGFALLNNLGEPTPPPPPLAGCTADCCRQAGAFCWIMGGRTASGCAMRCAASLGWVHASASPVSDRSFRHCRAAGGVAGRAARKPGRAGAALHHLQLPWPLGHGLGIRAAAAQIRRVQVSICTCCSCKSLAHLLSAEALAQGTLSC